MRRASADEAGGKLVEIGFAQGNRSGVDQPLDDGRRSGRCIRKPRTARRGRHAGQVDIVLDDKGNSVQGQVIDGTRLQGPHVAHDLIAGQTSDPDTSLLCKIGAIHQLRHDLGRRKSVRKIAAAQVGN